jgi:hypothetical protein
MTSLNLPTRWEGFISNLAQNPRWQEMTDGLADNYPKNIALCAKLLGGWLLATRAVVALVQFRLGFALGGQEDFMMLIALGFSFFRCKAVIDHLFGYTRVNAMDDRQFPRDHQAFWLDFRKTLIILFGLSFFWYWFGIIGALFLFHRLGNRHTRKLSEEYVQGTRLVSAETVNRAYLPAVQAAEETFWFGGVILPKSELATHFKIVGGTRSGKTFLLRLYMHSVLGSIGMMTCADRALLYDPKTQFYAFLVGIGIPEESIIISNVFDGRAYAWDLAADFFSRDHATTLAEILLPEQPGGNSSSGQFFDKAAKRILAAVAYFFMQRAPGQWTLRDLVLTVQCMELVELIAVHDRQLYRDLQVRGSGETKDSVLATISATVGSAFETIAAYLDHHQREGRTFNLHHWFESSSVLLLGRAPESEATLQPYNELLVTRFGQLATKEFREGYTHAIFDEAPTLGRVGRKLDELIRLGGEYKVSIAVLFQSYSSLEEMFGEKAADALLGQCDKSAYLRALNEPTAKWCSQQIGETYFRRWTSSTSSGTSSSGVWGQTTNTSGTSESENYVTEPAVMASTFMNLPRPQEYPPRGIQAYYKVGHHCYPFEIDSNTLTQSKALDDPFSPVFEPVTNRHSIETLRLWDESDLERLGLQEILDSATSKQLMKFPITDEVMEARCAVAESE